MGISVIISVYRKESGRCLDRALRSVWHDQTLRPRQVVLVEDGPLTDELDAVVAKWKAELGDVMTLLKNERNMGLTKSLNRAVDVAREEYIARMDTDDESLPCRFELQAAFLDAHPEIDVVGGALREFDDTCDNLNVRHYPSTPEACRGYVHKACPVAHPAVMMRRRMFDDGLRYDERYRVSQDIALWFDAIVAGYKIANLDDEIVRFRCADDVFKRRGWAKALNEFRIYMRGIRRLDGILTPKYIYPIARLVFRLAPKSIIKAVYKSSLRRKVIEG